MDDKTGKSLEQDLMFAVVKEKYGHLMNDEQLEEVRKTVVGHTADQRHRTLLDLQALQE